MSQIQTPPLPDHPVVTWPSSNQSKLLLKYCDHDTSHRGTIETQLASETEQEKIKLGTSQQS